MSIYDATVEMLGLLSHDDLEAVNAVVKRFIARERHLDEAVFQPMSEDEIMAKLENGRHEIEKGNSMKSESMEQQLAEEFGF